MGAQALMAFETCASFVACGRLHAVTGTWSRFSRSSPACINVLSHSRPT